MAETTNAQPADQATLADSLIAPVDETKYLEMTPESKELSSVQNFAEDQPRYKESKLREAQATEQYTRGNERLEKLYQPQSKGGGMPDVPDINSLYSEKNIPELKEEQKYAQDSTPHLLMVAVIGGLLGKKNAMVALEAQGDIVKNLNENNKNLYLKAKERRDDAVAKINVEAKRMMDVHKMLREATQDQIDSERLATDGALHIIGAERKSQDAQMAQYIRSYEKLRTQAESMQKFRITTGLREKLLGIQKMRAVGSQTLAWDKQYSALKGSKLTTSHLLDRFKNAQDKWNKFLVKNKLIGSSAAPFAPDLINKINTSVDPEYAELRQMFTDLAGSSLAVQNANLTSGAQRIRAVEITELQSIPSVEGKTPAMITRVINDMVEKITAIGGDIDTQTNFWESERSNLGFNNMPADATQTSPNPGSKTPPNHTLNGRAIVIKNNAWVYADTGEPAK